MGGLATGGGRSFAICQLSRGQPVMLHVGERLGDFTVAEIARGRVVFTTAAGERVVQRRLAGIGETDEPEPLHGGAG